MVWARHGGGFQARPWSVGSGCGAVLVDESAAGGVPLNRLGQTNHSNNIRGWSSLPERAMRPMLVVVSDILPQQGPRLTFVPDDPAVQQLVANASHPSLRKRVRSGRTGRGGDRLPAHSGEHVIETAGVLTAALVDHEPNGTVEAPQQIPCLLRLRARRVGGDPPEVHDPGVDLNEEQDVEPA